MTTRQAQLVTLSQALPDYEIGEELGRGAFGVVWAARHRQLGRRVAIKQLAAPVGDVDVHARSVDEARLLAALDHPNVVSVYDFVQAEGLSLLVMERLDGGTVGDRRGTLTAPAACVVVVAGCMGLHHAHGRGVLHRDVKPSNIMFSGAGVVRVTDFGIAKVVGRASTARTRTGALVGTPDYMAPEQIAGWPLSPATDVYAAGLVLYELLAGVKPFVGGDDPLAVMYQRVHGDPVPLLEQAPDVPPALAAVTARALRRDPDDRYSSARELAVAVSEAAGEQWGADWHHRTGVSLGTSLPLASPRSPPSAPEAECPHDELVEREQERSMIAQSLERSRRGSGTVLLLEGQPGIGKTCLLAGAAELARAEGQLVLRASGAQAETLFEFGVVRQLLDPVLRTMDADRARRLREKATGDALELLDPRGFLTSVDDGALRSIAWVVAELAIQTPVALFVDDVQWADEASLRVLAELARRIDGVAACAVLAMRPGAVGPAQLLDVPDVTRIRLRPLTVQGTRALARELTGTVVDARGAEAVHVATLGNPFLVGELVRAVPAIDAGTIEQVLVRPPRALIRWLLQRLSSLDDAAVPVAEAIVVLGDGAPVHHLTALTGLPEPDALRAAHALRSSGFLLDDEQAMAFAQPIVAAAVRAGLAPGARGEAHRKAAQLLHRDGADPERVAEQLLNGTPAGDPAMARLLVSAAAHAGARGAPEAAAAYLARALTEPPAPERVNEVHVALGAAELAAGRPGAGAEHLRAALAGDLPAQVRARGAIDLAHALWADSDVRGALAALEEHKRSLDARWALRLDVERATLGALAAEHAPEALRRMRGYRCLTPDSPAERLALALAAFGMAVDPASTAEEAASVALRALGNGRLLGEQDTYPPAHALALWVLLTAERLDAADAEVRRLAEHSSHRASRHALAVASVAAAFASGARGELSSALALAATEVERVLELPPGPMRGRLLSGAIQVLAEAFLARGDVGAAGIAIERGQAEGDPTSLELVPVRYARAALRLAQGDDEAALWEFLACGETYEAAGWEDRLVPWRGGAAEACARLGRIEDAVRLADELLALARGWGAPVAIARALRVRALTGPAGDAIALLTEADALLDGSYARLEHARALAELGSVLGREHRTTDAHRVLKRALSLAGRCGATAVEQRCVRELRRWS